MMRAHPANKRVKQSSSGSDGQHEAKNLDTQERTDSFDLCFNPQTDLIKILGTQKFETKALPFNDAKVQLELTQPKDNQLQINSENKFKERLAKRVSFQGLTEIQATLAPHLLNYKNVFWTLGTIKDTDDLADLCISHVINHVLKTRDRILRNNSREIGDDLQDDRLRDQAFTRPKALFLLPTRNAALWLVNRLIDLSSTDQCENKAKFVESFSLSGPETIPSNKPEDFRKQFSGNTDDMFRIGIKFTRKTVKLFVDFYSADIIIASPLGLEVAVESGQKSRSTRNTSRNKFDCDFLSSIEILVVTDALALQMQNWAHVRFVFEHINQLPKDSHNCDFNRVRLWTLEQMGEMFRQTILFSQFCTAEMNGLWRSFKNWRGSVKSLKFYDDILSNVEIRMTHFFHFFLSTDPVSDPDARFLAFTNILLPLIRHDISTGTALLYIPQYFDYLRVRNYLDGLTSPPPFGHISEYTKSQETARVRSYLQNGKFKLLLLTERAYWYHRHRRFRNIERVFFYQPPEVPWFYVETARWCVSPKAVSRVLCSKFDWLRLERILGSERAKNMCTTQVKGEVFAFK